MYTNIYIFSLLYVYYIAFVYFDFDFKGGMTPEQTYLTRQLILSAVAEERGARCSFMVELYNVFYTDQRVSMVMELMDGGSLQDCLDTIVEQREEDENQKKRKMDSNNFSFSNRYACKKY